MSILSLSNRLLGSVGLQLQRNRQSTVDTGCVTLRPAGEPRGRVLLSYLLQPLRHLGDTPDSGHTHNLESVLMARTWLDLGFIVDAIDYRNNIFEPREHYDWFTGARLYFREVADRLPQQTGRIVHLDTSHFAVNNAEAYHRLLACQARRGACLHRSVRLIEHGDALESAHFGILLGNAVTEETYHYAGRPLFTLGVPSVLAAPEPPRKSWDVARRRFIWLGSNGALHKGLDIVLEAFARMPDLHLAICGPVDQEPEFVRAYARELALPNITRVGWIDVGGEDFRRLLDDSVALVYPSCAEGQAGAAVNCIRAGLIPLLSRRSGVDVGEFGMLLGQCSVDEVCDVVTRVAAMPAEELYARSRAAWAYGQEHFSRDAYSRRYRQILETIESMREQKGVAA